MRRRKKRRILFFSLIVQMIGLMIFFYPVVSHYLAKRQQENVIIGHIHKIDQMDQNVMREEWGKAIAYNRKSDTYMSVLNIEGDGVMGYIEIPRIDARIPIYHYATEASLKKGVGHVEESGLPIGKKGNHVLLTGHRGLPNAQLFTRLDEMEMGDLFFIHVLDKTFVYEVNQITIVLPEEVEKQKEEPMRDLITLITCTPYGVNTHRLLVTGERTEYVEVSDEEYEVETSKRNKIILIAIILLTSAALMAYPYVTNRCYERKTEKQKVLFLQQNGKQKSKKEKLYEELERRNRELYENEQDRLTKEEAYQEATINLKVYGLKNQIISYISIPEIKVNLPVYLGASESNMKKGAVHLTETSYPIGGDNTNCVIAAHRGYSKAAMFREIEKLEIGDKVFLENFREKLEYEVVQLRVVAPDDISQILIQEGKDMLTLITCHPYRKNSQRYVVFCERR